MSVHVLKTKSKLASTPKNAPKYFKVLKDSNGKEIKLADPNVTRALVALMDMHAVIGGAACHWGGPAAFAEAMSAIHGIMFNSSNGKEWFLNYNFVNDAGHAENGVYALRANYGFAGLTFEDLWKFRSIESRLTGHGESHINPDSVLISNGPLGSGVPVAQGLSIADKIIQNERVTICAVSDGAMMEGETKEALAAIPGFAKKGKMNPFVLVISNNNTKLSGRIDQDSFSIEPTLDSLAPLGWKVIRIKEGHNLEKVYQGIEEAVNLSKNNSNEAIAVIVDTIKGYGNKETEKSASGGHGFPLKKDDGKIVSFINEIFNNNPPKEFLEYAEKLMPQPSKSESKSSGNKIPTEKVQAGIARGMIKAKEKGLPLFSVSADLQGSTGVTPFHKKFPDSFIEVGIAESNMVNTAIGLSKVGFIPVVDTFAQFGVTKGNLPFAMAQLSNAPVIGVFSHTGFQDAADGASHQATTYFSATMSLPNTEAVCLASAGEAENYMLMAAEKIAKDQESGHEGKNIIFFLGRENYPTNLKEGITYKWGEPTLLTDEDEDYDLLIVATGPMVEFATLAVKNLQEKHQIKAALINNPFVSHPNTKFIGKMVQKCGNKLLTIEDHQVIGGMGERLSHALLMDNFGFKIRSLGIKGHFGRSAYEAKELYEHFGLGVNDIVEVAKNLKTL